MRCGWRIAHSIASGTHRSLQRLAVVIEIVELCFAPRHLVLPALHCWRLGLSLRAEAVVDDAITPSRHH